MKSLRCLCLLLLLPLPGFSQEARSVNPQYTAENNLLIIRFVPKDKTGKIFFLGSKLADVNLDKDAKLLSVVMMTDKKKEELHLDANSGFYEVKSSKVFPKSYQLIIKTKIRDQVEDLELKVNPTTP